MFICIYIYYVYTYIYIYILCIYIYNVCVQKLPERLPLSIYKCAQRALQKALQKVQTVPGPFFDNLVTQMYTLPVYICVCKSTKQLQGDDSASESAKHRSAAPGWPVGFTRPGPSAGVSGVADDERNL